MMEENGIELSKISVDDSGNDKFGKMIISVLAIIGLFMLIIAAKTVIASAPTEGSISNSNIAGSSMTLKVDIPCSGHASLIIYEVKKLDGVNDVKFKGSGVFDVYYDDAKTSEKDILSLEIFREYSASKVQ